MEFDMIYKQKRNLIISQVIGVVFGLLLAVTGDYTPFWQMLTAILVVPVTVASLLRFVVRTYQIAKIKLGTKVYDNTGNYVIIERTGRGIAAAVVVPFLLIGIVTTLPQISQLLFYFLIVALIAVGALFCYKDIRFFVNLKKESNEQQEM